MTSYVGIIRIRLNGSKLSFLPLSPAYRAPLCDSIDFFCYTSFYEKKQDISENKRGSPAMGADREAGLQAVLAAGDVCVDNESA